MTLLKTLVILGTLLAIAKCGPNDECSVPGTQYDVKDGAVAVAAKCYHSGTAQLPNLVNFRNLIKWVRVDESLQKIIKACGKRALANGHSKFAIEFYGKCYTGDSFNFPEGGLLEKDDCRKCLLGVHAVGSSDVAVVYDLN